jgi:hypothetical protein
MTRIGAEEVVDLSECLPTHLGCWFRRGLELCPETLGKVVGEDQRGRTVAERSKERWINSEIQRGSRILELSLYFGSDSMHAPTGELRTIRLKGPPNLVLANDAPNSARHPSSVIETALVPRQTGRLSR